MLAQQVIDLFALAEQRSQAVNFSLHLARRCAPFGGIVCIAFMQLPEADMFFNEAETLAAEAEEVPQAEEHEDDETQPDAGRPRRQSSRGGRVALPPELR